MVVDEHRDDDPPVIAVQRFVHVHPEVVRLGEHRLERLGDLLDLVGEEPRQAEKPERVQEGELLLSDCPHHQGG